jgi:hypothetical protein
MSGVDFLSTCALLTEDAHFKLEASIRSGTIAAGQRTFLSSRSIFLPGDLAAFTIYKQGEA